MRTDDLGIILIFVDSFLIINLLVQLAKLF